MELYYLDQKLPYVNVRISNQFANAKHPNDLLLLTSICTHRIFIWNYIYFVHAFFQVRRLLIIYSTQTVFIYYVAIWKNMLKMINYLHAFLFLTISYFNANHNNFFFSLIKMIQLLLNLISKVFKFSNLFFTSTIRVVIALKISIGMRDRTTMLHSIYSPGARRHVGKLIFISSFDISEHSFHSVFHFDVNNYNYVDLERICV